MNNHMYPCLWMDGKGKEAAEFYCATFGNGKITADTPMVITFELSGQKFMMLNGGPQFKPTPATSFFVVIENIEEVKTVWEKLCDQGQVLMPLNKYDWSDLYGWVQDKYGISWQIAFGKLSDVHQQKFVTTWMFCGAHQGKAEPAMNFYAGLFKEGSIEGILRYPDGKFKNQITHAQMIYDGKVFAAMDSGVPQSYTFTEGISNVVECRDQQEIDYYWDKITAQGEESRCGWCKDEFGVWWQIIPANLGQLMSNPATAPKVGAALMQMKKMDIATLEAAAK